MTRELLVHRPHVQTSTTAYALFSRTTTWHFDAWLMLSELDLYLHIETRAGGKKVLGRGSWYVRDGELFTVPAVPEQARSVQITGRALSARYAELNRLHWTQVYPRSLQVPRSYRGRSALMHYIPAPSFDPCEGVLNLYTYQSRSAT